MATKAEMIAQLEAKGAKLTGNETADELKAMLKPSEDSDSKDQGKDPEKEELKAKLAALEAENEQLKKTPPVQASPKSVGEANSDKPKQKSGNDDADFDRTVNSVRKQLEAEDKRRILIPLMPGEPANTYQPFNINGYRVNVKKGVYVEVPATIADISEESFRQTEAAGTNLESSFNGNNLKLDAAPQETKDALTFS